MRKELIAAILLLAKSMGAFADGQAPQRLSEIPKEIQQCILLTADPNLRDVLTLALDQECAQKLTPEQQKMLLEVLTPNNQTIQGGPLVAK